MSNRLTITFGVCVAAGIAAGIGLARPGVIDRTETTTDAATPDVEPGSPASTAADVAAPGYGPTPSTDDAATPTPDPDASTPPSVTIEGFAFSGDISVEAGGVVEVVNADGAAHTLTADDRSFDTGNLAAGAQARFDAPGAPGTYRFFCAIHPSMQGTLTVTA